MYRVRPWDVALTAIDEHDLSTLNFERGRLHAKTLVDRAMMVVMDEIDEVGERRRRAYTKIETNELSRTKISGSSSPSAGTLLLQWVSDRPNGP